MRRFFTACYLVASAALALGAAWLWGFRCEGFGCTGLGIAWAAWAATSFVLLIAGAALATWHSPHAAWLPAARTGLALQGALLAGLALYWIVTQVVRTA